MSLNLTDADLSRLETVIRTLLSPLNYAGIDEWAMAVLHDFQPLLGYDQGVFGHSLGGALAVEGNGPRMEVASREYADYFCQVDPGVTVKRKKLGLEVYHRNDLYDPLTIHREEIFGDWCVPHKLFDPIGMSYDFGEGFPPTMHLYHDSEGQHPFAEREMNLLRLTLPAYKAGVLACARLARRRTELGNLFESCTDAICVTDTTGRVIHQNRNLVQLMATEPEHGRVLDEVRRTVSAVSSLQTHRDGHGGGPGQAHAVTEAGWRRVRTGRATYRLYGVLLGESTFAELPHVAVVVAPITAGPLSNEQLRERYGLTAREIEVARMLADGKSAAELADALHVSSHTARHHTENVMRKLGVERRAAVGCKLRDG
jgi:DNA-binding CsgD family transcriptional regulator